MLIRCPRYVRSIKQLAIVQRMFAFNQYERDSWVAAEAAKVPWIARARCWRGFMPLSPPVRTLRL